MWRFLRHTTRLLRHQGHYKQGYYIKVYQGYYVTMTLNNHGPFQNRPTLDAKKKMHFCSSESRESRIFGISALKTIVLRNKTKLFFRIATGQLTSCTSWEFIIFWKPIIFQNFWDMSFKSHWLTSYQNMYSNISFPKAVNKTCPCGVTIFTSHHKVITSSRSLQGYYIKVYQGYYVTVTLTNVCPVSTGGIFE